MPFWLPKIDLARILKKDSKYLFLCVANNSVGFGHLSRSLILASVFRDSGGDAEFLVFGSESARARVIQSGYRCFFCSWAEDSGASWEMNDISGSLLSYDGLIADVSHPFFFSFLADDRAKTCISLLERFDGVKVVIDSVAEQSFLERFPTVGASLQVVPYVTDVPLPFGPWRTLKGPDYAVLSESTHLLAKKRSIRDKADRILVTCGGSDLTCLTTGIMASIQELSDPVELTVVIGPLFSSEFANEIRKLAHSGRHPAKVVESPSSLTELMVWSDITIATSGLTKYELAATGTPAIVMSIDSFHDKVNQPFADLGSVVDIGHRWSSQRLANEVDQLRQNQQRRYEMSQVGKQLVDGFGAQRILKEVEAAIKC